MPASTEITDLECIAHAARNFCIHTNKHVGGSLSTVEIFVALFFGGVSNFSLRTEIPAITTDSIIHSKGHAAGTFYFCLWLMGLLGNLTIQELTDYGSQFSSLPRIPQRSPKRGIDMSAGSLGQGLSFANGLAASKVMTGNNQHTYVILGDGECCEGQVWEAAHAASRLGLSRVTAIVDVNSYGSSIHLPSQGLDDKWLAFGWKPVWVDGHSISSIIEALKIARTTERMCILAKTIKGYGLQSSLAGTRFCHNKVPGEAQYPDDQEQLGQLIQSARLALDNMHKRQAPFTKLSEVVIQPLITSQSNLTVPVSQESICDFSTSQNYENDKGWIGVAIGKPYKSRHIGKILSEITTAESRIVIISPDAASNVGLSEIIEKAGSWPLGSNSIKIIEYPMAEQDCASFAAGLAAGSMRPIILMAESFVWRMLDSVRQSICFQNLPVIIIGVSGGIGDPLGPMIQSDACFSAINSVVGLETFEAADINEAILFLELALKSCIPTYLRLPHEETNVRSNLSELRLRNNEGGFWTLSEGEAIDITIVGAGSTVPIVMEAKEHLCSQFGVQARVVQVFSPSRLKRFIKQGGAVLPKDSPVIGIHNAPSSILQQLLSIQATVLGVDDFGAIGKQAYLYEKYGLTSRNVVEQAMVLLEKHN